MTSLVLPDSELSDELLRVEDLVVRFPAAHRRTVHAVEGVSFDIRSGETVALVGESGSGKSTIGFTILRRYDPTAGTIVFKGQDITHLAGNELRHLRRDMQIIFQDPYSSLNPRMKVGDIVGEPLIVHEAKRKKGDRERLVADLLGKCGLPATAASRYPSAFSGGERQRIAIARALALNPSLIVADEAVSALDVSIRAQIVNLLADLQRDLKLSYLFISHDLAVVRHAAQRIVILYAGKVMEQGPTEEIFSHSMHPYTHALLSASPVANPQIERSRPRIILRGEIPSVMEPPTGCVFRTRCPLAIEKCTVAPPLAEITPGRRVACWRAADAASLPGTELAAAATG